MNAAFTTIRLRLDLARIYLSVSLKNAICEIENALYGLSQIADAKSIKIDT